MSNEDPRTETQARSGDSQPGADIATAQRERRKAGPKPRWTTAAHLDPP